MAQVRIGNMDQCLVDLFEGDVLTLDNHRITKMKDGKLWIERIHQGQVAAGNHIAQAGNGGTASVTVNGKTVSDG